MWPTLVRRPVRLATWQAKVLQPASTASASKVPEQIATYGVLGAAAGALIGFFVALVIGRNDRRLVERAAIANSIAAPVLASIAAERPSDAAHWARLLEEYEPEAVDAWGINKLLQRFGVAGIRANGNGGGRTFSLTVFSLSGDVGALALGPQLAAFAATLGIPTALVVGPQQDANTAATLRTACAAPQASGRRKPLRLIAAEDGRVGQVNAAFVVVVMVVDGKDPRIPDMDHTTDGGARGFGRRRDRAGPGQGRHCGRRGRTRDRRNPCSQPGPG